MENKKQGISLGVVILFALVALVMGIVAYKYFKDISTNKLVKGFEINLESIKENNKENKDNSISTNGKGSIETYLDKIFLGNGLYAEALPQFNSIEETNKDWLYSVLYYNLASNPSGKSTFTYEEIQTQLKGLVGNNTSMEFPQEGTDKIVKKSNTENIYEVQKTEVESDSYQGYTISNISIIGGNYIAVINEFQYKLSEDKQSYIFVDKYGKAIKTYPSSYDNEEEWKNNLKEMKDYVTKNTDRFIQKEVTIGKDVQTGNVYVISVKVK